MDKIDKGFLELARAYAAAGYYAFAQQSIGAAELPIKTKVMLYRHLYLIRHTGKFLMEGYTVSRLARAPIAFERCLTRLIERS